MTPQAIPRRPALYRADAQILRAPKADGRLCNFKLAGAVHRARTCAVMEEVENTTMPAI